MAIDFSDNTIKKDDSIVRFPREAGGDATVAMITGFDDTENLRLAKVTSDGKLMVDANVSVSSISIGDIRIKAPDVSGAESLISRTINNDGTSALYVQDKRLSFTNNKLDVNIYGTLSQIKTDGYGNLFANIISAVDTNDLPREKIFSSSSYNTSDEYGSVRSDLDARRYINKTFYILNNGTNPVLITIKASVDNGVNYDITLSSDVELLASNSMVIDEQRAFTNIAIYAKNKNSGQSSTVITKGYCIA